MNSKAHIKSAIKNILSHLLYYSGVLGLLESILLYNKCIILVYHRIIDPKTENEVIQDGMYVKPEHFEQQINYLKTRFNVVNIKTFLDLFEKKKLSKHCLITFDDGWIDNYTNAFSILRESNITSTIFLSTNNIDTTKMFWTEKILNLVQNINNDDFKGQINEITNQFLNIVFSPNKNDKSIGDGLIFLKKQSLEMIEEVIKELEISAAQSLPDKRRMLSWAEVLEMYKYGIGFGSHTKSHSILTNLNDDKDLEKEIRESKEIIELQIQNEVSAFCYPNGNYDNKIVDIVKKYYKCAFSNESGYVDSKDNLYSLRRIRIHDDASYNIPMFVMTIVSNLLSHKLYVYFKSSDA